MGERNIWWVDLPDPHDLGENAAWKNVGIFTSKEEAVAWIRENVGNCDDDGKLPLLIEGRTCNEE